MQIPGDDIDDSGDEEEEFLYARPGGDQHEDSGRQSVRVLLVLDTLIGGDECVESMRCRPLEDIAVLASGPTHLLYGAPLECLGEASPKLSRNRLVKP